MMAGDAAVISRAGKTLGDGLADLRRERAQQRVEEGPE
jgi:hypothetical protein